MRPIKNWLIDRWKSGWAVTAPLAIIVYLAVSAARAFSDLLLIPVFSNNTLNILANLFLWLAAFQVLAGVLRSLKLFRSVANAFIGKIPFVSPLVKFFFKSKKSSLQRSVDSKRKQAVYVEHPPRSNHWFVGHIAREWLGPKDPRDKNSKIITWCTVQIFTYPVPFTGYAVNLPKDQVVFLKMTVQEAFLDAAGFYLSEARHSEENENDPI